MAGGVEALVNAVFGILLCLFFDVTLGGEHALSFEADCGVDMGSAAGVGDGLDGAEVVAALGVGQESTIPLKVLIALGTAFVPGVEIGAFGSDLPNLHQGVANGFPFDVAHDPGEVGDFTRSGSDRVGDDQEIVVGIEWKFVRVKGTFSLTRSSGELIGVGSGSEEGGGAQSEAGKELAAVPGFDEEIVLFLAHGVV